MFYDRNPESMRTVPGVCAAARDSVPRDARISSRNRVFSKNRPEAPPGEKTVTLEASAVEFETPEFFRFFRDFNLPQHSLMLASNIAPT